ncbi:MAG TPA: hypothetical protein VHA07_09565 [Devosia sp.]|jgi:hypothetical protein|nr:hypothetical protein [Devosia sp.]
MPDVEQLLTAATASNSPEFLIASHRGGATLKRVWNGRISNALDQTRIGRRALLSAVVAEMLQQVR